MIQKLEGKTVVVIGATGDIGGGLAQGLHDLGADLVVVGRNEEALNFLVEKYGGKRMLAVKAESSKADDVKRILEETLRKFGKADALITSVGKWKQVDIKTPFANFAEQLHNDMESFVKAATLPIFLFNQHFREKGQGLIIDISSHAAEGFLPGNLTYSPVKSTVKAFLEGLRGENEDKPGVKIGRIIAQLVDTPKNRASFPNFTEEEWESAVQIGDMVNWIARGLSDQELPHEQMFRSKIII